MEADGESKNFAIVDNKVSGSESPLKSPGLTLVLLCFPLVSCQTSPSDIEAHFTTFTQDRKDIAILLINQHIAEKIRPLVDKYTQAFPALLEIPSKEHPYGEISQGRERGLHIAELTELSCDLYHDGDNRPVQRLGAEACTEGEWGIEVFETAPFEPDLEKALTILPHPANSLLQLFGE